MTAVRLARSVYEAPPTSTTVSARVDPVAELFLPDETEIEERDLVTDGDVLIGARSEIEFGIRARNIVAGERVRFGGHIEVEEDCRLDMWCVVADNVLVGNDAYLGERTRIDGRLVVAGDLDIGDDVQIADGFEANGWIVIRNPMPTIVFLFIYLSHLLRAGEEDTAEELLSTVIEDEEADELPLTIPRGAALSDDSWHVSTPATIGDGCRLHGNIRATSITMGEETNCFGSLRARGDISIGSRSRIHGDVTTRAGSITLADGVEILGDVSCQDLSLGTDARVDGAIRASGEMTMAGPGRDPER